MAKLQKEQEELDRLEREYAENAIKSQAEIKAAEERARIARVRFDERQKRLEQRKAEIDAKEREVELENLKREKDRAIEAMIEKGRKSYEADIAAAKAEKERLASLGIDIVETPVEKKEREKAEAERKKELQDAFAALQAQREAHAEEERLASLGIQIVEEPGEKKTSTDSGHVGHVKHRVRDDDDDVIDM